MPRVFSRGVRCAISFASSRFIFRNPSRVSGARFRAACATRSASRRRRCSLSRHHQLRSTPNVFALIIFSCRIRYIHLQRVGDMDFDQLTTFVQVAKLKSFSKAGQKVFRSQSAVSAQIRQLEQSYKAKLLDRSAKSVELTPAGVVLFDYAERLLRLRDESMQIVADRGSVVQGPVTFGANEATCLYLLPDILPDVKRRHPLVHISIYRNSSHKILQRLEEGSLHIGIVTLPLKSPNLKMHVINRDRLRFMVSTKNPLSQRSHVTLEEIASAPLIFPRMGYTRQVLDKLFRPYRSRLQVAMELPSIGMIKTFVAADVGISIISESFARDQVKTGEVKLLNVEGVDLWRELALVYRRDRSLPRAVQALINMIRESRKPVEAHD